MRPGRPFLLSFLIPLLLSACAAIPTLPSVTPPAEDVFRQVTARQEALSGLQADPAEYPVVERVCTEIVSLPMCAFLTPDSQERVIAAVELFLDRGRS